MSGAGLRGAAAPAAVALLAAFGAKAWHAGAAPESFRWLLAPTAALAGALAGVPFEAERGVGYLSRDLALVIAPACAGVNFLVVAFLALALGFAPRIEGRARRWSWLLAAAALAYLATLVVNAVRIALGAALRGAPLPAGLAGDEAHRLLGVAVYLGALWLLVFAVARAFARRAGAWAVALPLALYLGVTLLAPLARGGWARPEFWPHARAVALASLALAAALLAALRAGAAARQAHARRAGHQHGARVVPLPELERDHVALHLGDAAAEHEVALREGAAAVLEGEREHAPARPGPVLHELVQPGALERAVDEDVVVPLALRVVAVVVDAVRVVRGGAEEEELRAARVLHQRRHGIARLDVLDVALGVRDRARAHRAIRRPRRIATTSFAWFV